MHLWTGGAQSCVLGKFFCLTLYVYTQNRQNFVEISKIQKKMDEKTQERILTLTRPPGQILMRA